MFQRKWFQNKQLDPEAWKTEIQACSAAWRGSNKTERDVFEAQAAYEQGQKEEAALQPFPSFESKKRGETRLGNASFDATSGMRMKAAKAVSRERLQTTYADFHNSDNWALWNGGISSSTGCLKLDLIDLKSGDDEIQKAWSSAFHAPIKQDLWSNEQVAGCKHDVCAGLYGTRSKQPHVKLASLFVSALHNLVATGCLVTVGLL